MSRLSILSHILHGLIAGVLAPRGWLGYAISLFLFVQFFVYELVEESKIQDEMFHELKEWSFGFIIGLVISLCVFPAL
jgi:hypothetical protein